MTDHGSQTGSPATTRSRRFPGSAPTSGRAPADRGCGRATTVTSSARSWPCSPTTGSTSRGRSATGPTSCPSRTGSTKRCSSGSATSSTRTSSSGCTRSRRSSSATCPARTGTRPWRQGRDLYRDVWLVSQQAWFAERDRPAVRPAPRRRRLARLERDAALRRRRHERRDRRLGARWSSRRSAPPARPSRSRSATARGASRSPATTTATRCARSHRSSTSSARTPIRCRTTRCACS